MSGTIARDEIVARVFAHLQAIYHDCEHRQGRNLELAEALCGLMRLDECSGRPVPHHNNWDQSDVAVITYGDTVQRDGEKPLRTLRRFLHEKLAGAVSIVHILPFFPWSSDDGFAVIDYEQVNERMGDWSDIEAIAGEFRLMADLVINHCSSNHAWFAQFERDEEPGRSMFFCASPDDDLDAVVRPRTTPLLRPTPTPAGTRHVWCTFGHDQVDFDFCNPQVLVEFVRIIRHYLDHGVQVFRLDAVAFLWKKIGSSCLNLDETHEIVRLLRTLIEHADHNAMIITETNIPNRENLAYFGNANEAHCVYNFSLPPLLVNTLVAGNCHHLKNWMMSMPPAQNGTCYFNFIAPHDGIGLRPAEGLLSDGELQDLIDAMQASGGRVSWRALKSGETRPYEINISLYDAMSRTLKGPDEWQQLRFVCAHAIMLGLEGIPAFYLQSLIGTTNDYERLELTGHMRHINRRQWSYPTLMAALEDDERHHGAVLDALTRLIDLRRQQPAFHPNATQYVLHLGDEVFAYWRQSLDRGQSIFCLNNVTDREQNINLADLNLIETKGWHDLISGMPINNLRGTIALAPYQSAWLASF